MRACLLYKINTSCPPLKKNLPPPLFLHPPYALLLVSATASPSPPFLSCCSGEALVRLLLVAMAAEGRLRLPLRKSALLRSAEGVAESAGVLAVGRGLVSMGAAAAAAAAAAVRGLLRCSPSTGRMACDSGRG